VGPSARGVDDAFPSRAGHDRTLWFGAARHHADRRPRAERIATEIIVGEPEVLDQSESIISKNVGWVRSRLVRLGAVTVTAQIGHDDPISACRNPGRMPITHPVDGSRRKEAVDEYQRSSLAHLAKGECQAIARSKILDRKVGRIRSHRPYWRW